MSFEDFLKQNNCLRAFCENVKEYNKERRWLVGVAYIDSFVWADTHQGWEYWRNINVLQIGSITERQTYDYFENHPCLHVNPPKCLRRL